MDPVNLLHELLSTLAALPADVPSDLVRVHPDHSRRHGCVPCRFRERGRVEVCGCQRELAREGAEGLGTSSIWMAMTLVVRPVGAKRDGLVFLAVGVDTEGSEFGCKPRPFIWVIGTEGRAADVQERWPSGFLRAVLVSAIFDEAIACGTKAITHDGYGRYSRTDTAVLLADCNVDRMFGMKSPANPDGDWG